MWESMVEGKVEYGRGYGSRKGVLWMAAISETILSLVMLKL